MKTKLNALSAWLDRHALPLGAALAAALSLLLALYNVGGGPLGNLNDIGGWRNRALYIALTAAIFSPASKSFAPIHSESLLRCSLSALFMALMSMYVFLFDTMSPPIAFPNTEGSPYTSR